MRAQFLIRTRSKKYLKKGCFSTKGCRSISLCSRFIMMGQRARWTQKLMFPDYVLVCLSGTGRERSSRCGNIISFPKSFLFRCILIFRTRGENRRMIKGHKVNIVGRRERRLCFQQKYSRIILQQSPSKPLKSCSKRLL